MLLRAPRMYLCSVKFYMMASWLFIGFIVNVVVVLGVYLVVKSKKERKRIEELFKAFRQFAEQYKFAVSKKERLGMHIIALDDIHHTLLIVNENNTGYEHKYLALDTIFECKLRKAYSKTIIGCSHRNYGQLYLQSIVLDLSCKNQPTLSIPFYEATVNNKYEISELEEKAKHWETMLLQLMHSRPPGAVNPA